MWFFELIKRLFESLFQNVSIVAAPLAAAVITGFSAGELMATEINLVAGIVVGVAVGFALEACGYLSFVAIQKDRNYWRPVLYVISGVLIALILESPLVPPDWKRFATTIVVFIVVGMTYWNYVGMNASLLKLNDKITTLNALDEAGYKIGRGGKLQKIGDSKKTPNALQSTSKKSTPKSTKRKRYGELSLEEKRSLLDLNYSEFVGTYGDIVGESSFYNWRRKVESES